MASRDFAYAAELFEQQEQPELAQQMREGAERVKKVQTNSGGNGLGGAILSSATGLFQKLLPLAVKYFAPAAF
jgi:hypothetical protein